MRFRTVLACLAFFSSFALLGSFLGSDGTYALWGDEADTPPVTIQPGSIQAETSSVSLTDSPYLTLVNSPDPQVLGMSWDGSTWVKSPATTILAGGSSDYLGYSYVGSQFVWDTSAAADQIVRQIEDDPTREWYGVAGLARITAASTGTLSWGVLAQWTPKQTSSGSLWDKSLTSMRFVDDPTACIVPDNPAQSMGTTAYADDFRTGPRFAPDMPHGPTDVFVCVIQAYQPGHHTNTAVAQAPGENLTSDPTTWSAVLYDQQPHLDPSQSPVLGLYITPIDPLHGPARDSSGP